MRVLELVTDERQTCNTLKWTLSQAQFLAHVAAVARHAPLQQHVRVPPGSTAEQPIVL